MKPPCDEAVVRSAIAGAPCSAQAGPWILAATILASSMAFIDSTVVNVALPELQIKPPRERCRRAMGSGILRIILGRADSRWRFPRRSLWPPLDVPVGRGDFRDRVDRLRISSNIQQLIVARSIQGVGAAFLVPGSLSIISASFDETLAGKRSAHGPASRRSLRQLGRFSADG